MNKIYIPTAGLLSLLAVACNKDNSTGASRLVGTNKSDRFKGHL